MANFYIFSDCHGFYNELRTALDEAGFDPNDENSWLIGAGDFTDRGPDPEKVINYLMRLERFIGVRGNHEDLMEEMIERRCAMRHDWHNGTMQSVIDLAPEAKTANEAFDIAWKKLKPFYDTLVDYVELGNYVICHSFVPYNKYKDWRKASVSQWEKARWVNAMDMVMNGYVIDKCVISGHYHTSYGHALQDKTFDEWGEEADFSPFYYENKLISIDSCCAHTGKINILKIEDDFING